MAAWVSFVEEAEIFCWRKHGMGGLRSEKSPPFCTESNQTLVPGRENTETPTGGIWIHRVSPKS